YFFFFFQAEDGIRDDLVTGVQTCALPICTNRLPFLQSRASIALSATTVGIMLAGVWLPSSPLAPALGLTHLPHLYWPLLAVTLRSEERRVGKGCRSWWCPECLKQNCVRRC